jgi:hypothetical protein
MVKLIMYFRWETGEECRVRETKYCNDLILFETASDFFQVLKALLYLSRSNQSLKCLQVLFT